MVGELTWRKRLFGLWLPLLVFVVIALFPFTWMAATSLKTNAELYNPKASPLSIQHPSLVHYIDLLKETNFLSGSPTRCSWPRRHRPLAPARAMLAYPLARMRFRGAPLLAIAVAVTYLIPQTLLFVPMADLIGRMKLGNTLSAVMLTYPTLLVPFIAWLLMGYFKTVPKELEEQAMIDGASRWRAMTRIILPSACRVPVRRHLRLHAVAERVPLRPALPQQIERAYGADRGRGRADPRRRLLLGPADGRGLLGSIPVALIYSFFVKYYVAGLTAGAVKG